MIMELKKEIMPLYSTVLVELFDENPYEVAEQDGFKLTNGQFDSPDSGNREKKEQYNWAGRILDVGPDCKYAKGGDHCIFDIRASRPINFKGNYYFQVAEQNIIALLGDDLTERFSK